MNNIFNPVSHALPDIVSATILTVVIAILAAFLAMIFAIPAGFGRLSRSPIIRSVATVYVETIRGTPFLLQLIVWVYGVKTLLIVLFNFNVDVQFYNLLTALNSNNLYPANGGVSIIFFGVVALGFNYGAYLAEVIRAGVLAVDRGQTEAAETLGFSRFQVARLVVLPQALRLMIPPLTNNFITLVQDTSFLAFAGIMEIALTIQGQAQPTSNTFVRWEFYIIELALYFVICYSISLVGRRYENSATRRPSLMRRMFGVRPRATVQV